MKKRTKRNSGGQDTGNEGHLLRDRETVGRDCVYFSWLKISRPSIQKER